MKRSILLALVALSACKINDATFTPLGGGDDAGPGDGRLDTMIDGPNGTGMRRGFYLDGGQGLFVLDKSTTGALSLSTTNPIVFGGNQPLAVATNRTGTHVYVAISVVGGGGEIRDMTFTGTTLVNANTKSVPCAARGMAVSGDTRTLAVSCSTPQLFTFQLDVNGAVVGNAVQLSTQGTGTKRLAFSPDGHCLFVADPSAGQGLTWYTYQASSASYSMGATVGGPQNVVDLVVHPSGNFLYMTTDVVVQSYGVTSDCTLTMMGFPPSNGMAAAVGSVIDPAGSMYFAIGDRIAPFTIAGDGTLTAVSAGAQLSGNHVDGTFDPALPDTLYVTSRSGGGVLQAKINAATGVLTMAPGYMAPPPIAPQGFALAP